MAMLRLAAGARSYRQRARAAGIHLPALGRRPRPDVLLISCTDPRLHPAFIIGSLPGEVFELRTPGGFVPREPDTADARVLTEALRTPTIKDAVILGHSHCPEMSADGPDSLEARHDHVTLQLAALRSLPDTETAMAGPRRLRLHGWYHDLETGTTTAYLPGTGIFAPV
ncbi:MULTISPECIES: carbonic anhydrase [Streptomyces]|uniref:carbonic anhydrase n=1 Tax=Streptomyces TaxID=1883 RepID=UPI00163CC549|nr:MULTISPECIES: carbonic anhydrase [Streptomyces]GLX19842.1 carbonic anhydrase [Streptomyces lavendulae subsp. lavendulae]GLX27338.1 carbonic anhydrase [Streptomyces lavendulae subsp. lavendulae]